jgi:long-chain acyl-CoA synthetase
LPRLTKFAKGDFADFLDTLASSYGNRNALSCFENNSWSLLSYEELRNRATYAASRLQTAGILPHSHVAILGESSIDWVIHFFAITLCGATVIPLDTKLAEAELANILEHCEPTMILSSPNYRNMARKIRTTLKSLPKLLGFQDSRASLEGFDPYQRVKMNSEEPIVICYTSGTSGSPKGVMIPLRALVFEFEAMYHLNRRAVGKKDVLFSVLPLNHLFGLSSGLFFALRSGMEFCMAHDLDPQAILFCLKARRVTNFQVVPLFLKLLMRSILQKAAENFGERKFRRLLKSSALIRLPALKKIAFKKIHDSFGGTLKRFICGGSELDPQIFEFFSAIGMPVFNGYGLTETGPVIALNVLNHNLKGSVGKALPGVSIKIADGEILTKGPHVMLGYYKNEQLTRETLDTDGWLHTGDMGYLDKKGYLHLNGRKKNLIVLSSGKKIHPEELESVLLTGETMKDICVIGLPSPSELGEKIVAVVIPMDEASETSVKNEIQKLLSNVASYKRPTEIHIRRQAFATTASMKVKRHLVRDELLSANLRVKKNA